MVQCLLFPAFFDFLSNILLFCTVSILVYGEGVRTKCIKNIKQTPPLFLQLFFTKLSAEVLTHSKIKALK